MVLIVDDDPIQRRNIKEYLIAHGIFAESAENGFSAVAAVKKLHPAIVLLDIRMPGLDGIEVARHAAKVSPKPKIILMSGHPDAVYDANTADIEVFTVLQKPIPLKILADFVKRALSRNSG